MPTATAEWANALLRLSEDHKPRTPQVVLCGIGGDAGKATHGSTRRRARPAGIGGAPGADVAQPRLKDAVKARSQVGPSGSGDHGTVVHCDTSARLFSDMNWPPA